MGAGQETTTMTTTERSQATRAENRYCQPCMKTTSHLVKAQTYCCLRCNSVKTPVAPARG